MALTGKDIAKLKLILEDLRSEIASDTKGLIKPLEEEMQQIRERVDRLYEMETEDIKAAFRDIEVLRKKINTLEMSITGGH